MLCYDRLPYMDFGRVDEFRWLAQQVPKALKTKGKAPLVRAQMRGLLETAAFCFDLPDPREVSSATEKSARVNRA